MSPRRRRRRVRRYVLVLLLLVLAGGAWIGWKGLAARRHLTAARPLVAAIEDDLLAGETGSARARIAALRAETRAAREATGGPVWSAYAAVPFLGNSLDTARGLAVAADELATDTLPPLAEVDLSPRALRPAGDTIGIEPLRRAAAPLAAASRGADGVLADVRGLPGSWVLPPVGRARTELLAELEGLAGRTRAVAAAAEVAPAMLGADRPRRYFLAIQNNAEARATGGLLGAYGVLEADRGRLRLVTLGVNSELRNTTPVPAVDLGAEFASRYRRFASDSFWINANMSPHFPYANAIWTALARRTMGASLDGTIAVDPVAMGYILGVTGPARLPSGEVVPADRIVDLTERDAYVRFRDNDQRDRYLQDVARAVYGTLTSGAGDVRALLSAFGRAAGEGHLRLASTTAAEQAVLERTPLAGALPAAPGPYLQVVTQNAGGNKLDYYLRRSVSYTARPAEDDGRPVTVRVELRNTAPPGLPDYVRGRLDLPGGRAPVEGQGRVYLSVYLAPGAGLRGAMVDGQPLVMESEVERGLPVFSAFVSVDPGKPAVVELDVVEPPGSSGLPRVDQQPLVVPDELSVSATARG